MVIFVASNFLLGNAEASRGYPVIYCSDGFCQLTGFKRHEVLGNSSDCTLLYGMETSQDVIYKIRHALETESELISEVTFAKKDGKKTLNFLGFGNAPYILFSSFNVV